MFRGVFGLVSGEAFGGDCENTVLCEYGGGGVGGGGRALNEGVNRVDRGLGKWWEGGCSCRTGRAGRVYGLYCKFS